MAALGQLLAQGTGLREMSVLGPWTLLTKRATSALGHSRKGWVVAVLCRRIPTSALVARGGLGFPILAERGVSD